MRFAKAMAYLTPPVVRACGSAHATTAGVGDYESFSGSCPNTSGDIGNAVTHHVGGSLTIDRNPGVDARVVARLARGNIFAPLVVGNLPTWPLAFCDSLGNIRSAFSGLQGLLAADSAVPSMKCGAPSDANCVGVWTVSKRGTVPVPGALYFSASGSRALPAIGNRRLRTDGPLRHPL